MQITLWNEYNGITIDSHYFSLYIGTPVLIALGVIALAVGLLRRVKKVRGI